MLFWILFGLINITSLMFYFVVSSRVKDYTSQFLRHESISIRLFRIISIRHVFIAYFIGLIVLVVLQLLYILFVP